MAPPDARALFRKAKKDRPVAVSVRVRAKPVTPQPGAAKLKASGGLRGLGAYADPPSVIKVVANVNATPTPAPIPATTTKAIAPPPPPRAAVAPPSTDFAVPATAGNALGSGGSVVPEGFFDDKRQDAKVRHVAVKEDLGDEYAAFQKSLAVETEKSEKVEAYDDDVAATRRLVAEVHEQESQMARLRKMKSKYDARKKVKTEERTVAPVTAKQEDDDDDSDDDDDDNWRARGAF